MIFIDSSFLVAYFLVTDSQHKRAHKLYPVRSVTYAISEDILKETLTIINQRLSRRDGIVIYKEIKETFMIEPVTKERFETGMELFLDPALQKDISVIDCTTTAICRELGITKILAFDPHFRALGLTTIPKQVV